jgi:hypothetical protein
LAGATFTDSFRASSFFFSCSDGVALLFGEGFGAVFASTGFFGVDLGVGFAVGFADAFGMDVDVMVRFVDGEATGVREGVGVDSCMSLVAEVWRGGSFCLSGAGGGTSGGGFASLAVSARDGGLIAATSPLIHTMLCRFTFRVSRLQRTSPIIIAR